MKRTAFTLTAILCGVMTAATMKTTTKAVEVNKPAAVKNLKAVKVTEKSVKLRWSAVKGANGYTVFSYNTKTKKYKKLKTTTKKTYTVKKGLKKNKASRYMVQAFHVNGAKKQYAPFSKTISVYPKGSKKENVKKVILSDASLTVEEGAVFKLPVTFEPSKKTASKAVTFTSSNPYAVKVKAGGVLTAENKGRSTITAYAHNGVSAKITIWVLGKEYNPTIHRIKRPDNLKVHPVNTTSVKLTWKKCGYVSGYKIYLYNAATKKYTEKKVIKGKKTSAVISGLKADVNYTFMVKGWHTKKGISVYGVNSYLASGCVTGGKLANATSIRFEKNEYQVMEDETVKLNCVIEPANVISRAVTYVSSKENIATVSADGVVTGHKEGKTYITAYSHNGLSVRVPVRVTENVKYANRVSVLCFHRVVSNALKKSKFSKNEWVAAVSDFERQMKYLYDNHYTTLSLDEFYNWYKKKKNVPAKTVVLTFDDGDYEFYHIVYPILKKYKFKATMFIVGSRTGDTTHEYEDVAQSYYLGWDKINEMKRDYPNISFQSHTYNMHYAKMELAVYELTLAQIYEDFETNRVKGIESKNPYQYMAYPYGGFNDDAVYCAKKFNYRLAFDFGPGRRATRDDSCYHIPRMKINGQITMANFIKRL